MSKKNKNSRVLRDLIRIGVFSALLLVVTFAIACTIGYFPLLMLTVMPCILGCVCGIIYMVMLSKLTIVGGLFISSTLLGLCLVNMAPYGFAFITSLVGGALGEGLHYLLGKNSLKGKTAGICMISVFGSIGQYAPFIWMKEAYLNLYSNNSHGTLPIVEYSIEHVSIPVMVALTIANLIFSILGCYLGNRIIERNFRKSAEK